MQKLLFGVQTVSLRTATRHFMFLISSLEFQIQFLEPRNSYKNGSANNESEAGGTIITLGDVQK